MEINTILRKVIISFLGGVLATATTIYLFSDSILNWMHRRSHRRDIIELDFKNQYTLREDADIGKLISKLSSSLNGEIEDNKINLTIKKGKQISGELVFEESESDYPDLDKYAILKLNIETRYKYIDESVKNIESLEDKVHNLLIEEEKSRKSREYIFSDVNPFDLDNDKDIEMSGQIKDSGLSYKADNDSMVVRVDQVLDSDDLEWVKKRLFTG